MRAKAVVECTNLAAATVREALRALPRKQGEVFVLVYLAESTDRDGAALPGFRPGYIPSVWARSSTSDNWVTARLPDGTVFDFLPRIGWGIGGRFALDVVDAELDTFSIVRA